MRYVCYPPDRLPAGKIIPSKGAFHHKKDHKSNIALPKVRRIAKDLTQKLSVDFTENIRGQSPINPHRNPYRSYPQFQDRSDGRKTRISSWSLGEKVYMAQPKGVEEPRKKNYVVWFNRTLYGLMQAAGEESTAAFRYDREWARTCLRGCLLYTCVQRR